MVISSLARGQARYKAGAMYSLVGSVLELHAAGTHHRVVSAGGKHHSCGDEERVHGGGLLPAQTVHLSSSIGE